jgi:hypothetical protein
MRLPLTKVEGAFRKASICASVQTIPEFLSAGEPGNLVEPARRPTTPARLGPIPIFPGCTEWQTAHCLVKTCAPCPGSLRASTGEATTKSAKAAAAANFWDISASPLPNLDAADVNGSTVNSTRFEFEHISPFGDCKAISRDR